MSPPYRRVQVSLIPCRPPSASPMIAAMATTRRADMFIDLKDDPRENRPKLGDERTTLVEFLRNWQDGSGRSVRERPERSDRRQDRRDGNGPYHHRWSPAQLGTSRR